MTILLATDIYKVDYDSRHRVLWLGVGEYTVGLTIVRKSLTV